MGIETLALIGLAGGAMSAVGSLQKGAATKQAADYNAAADQQRAAGEKDAAAADASDTIVKGSRMMGSATAMRGATGVTMEGSPLMVDEDTVRQVALGAARKLQGGNVRASRLQDDATLQTMKGDNAVTSSYLDAGSSLLTSAGKFGGSGWGSGSSSSGTGFVSGL